MPRPSDEGEEGDESPADDSRETVEKRRELLTQCAELLNREEQPLLHSLVQLQLARCSAALGVDEEAIAKHPDVMRVLRAAAEKTSADEESSAPPPSSPQPQEDEDGGRTALVRRPSHEVIIKGRFWTQDTKELLHKDLADSDVRENDSSSNGVTLLPVCL